MFSIEETSVLLHRITGNRAVDRPAFRFQTAASASDTKCGGKPSRSEHRPAYITGRPAFVADDEAEFRTAVHSSRSLARPLPKNRLVQNKIGGMF